MAFSRQLGTYSQQPQGSLLRLPLDSLREIAYATPYEDLSNLCRSSAQYRRICQAPDFWWRKTQHDFPDITEESFRELDERSERSDRYRYHLLYHAKMEEDREALRGKLEKLKREYERKEKDLVEQLDSINATIEFLDQEWRKQFLDDSGYLPRVLTWDEDDYESMPLADVWSNADGVFYSYRRRNGDVVDVDITDWYEYNQPLRLSDVILSRGRMSLDEFMELLELGNGMYFQHQGERINDRPQRDDILMYPRDDVNHYVYQRPDGQLEVVPFSYQTLPREMLEMFKRRKIHSLDDLRLVYGNGPTFQEIVGPNNGLLYIPESETAYKERREGYYHESLV